MKTEISVIFLDDKVDFSFAKRNSRTKTMILFLWNVNILFKVLMNFEDKDVEILK